MPSATPDVPKPKSADVGVKTAENSRMKLDEQMTPAKPMVSTNNSMNVSSKEEKPKIQIAKIRVRDDTYDRVLKDSIRLV